MLQKPAAPPARLVENGVVTGFGMFGGAIGDVNLEELRPRGPLSPLRFKQWQHVAIVHPEVALTFAVVDVGYLKLGWAQAIDRASGQCVHHERKSPFLDVRIARSLFDEHTWLRSRGLRVELHNHLDAGCHRVEVEGQGVHAELTCLAEATPLVVCLPLGRGRAMYSHKVPLPVEGHVRVAGRDIALDPSVTTAIFDIHKAHYPHRTWWKWGTFAGTAGDLRIAVNLTSNVVPDPAFHENALWVDGELSVLPSPAWEMRDTDPWRAIGDGYRLEFTGDGERWENLDVGLIRSKFRQRYGRWSGEVAGHALDGAWGLAEDHHSAW